MRKIVMAIVGTLALGLLAACAAPAPPTVPPAASPAATVAPADITRAPGPTAGTPAAAPAPRQGGDLREVATSDAKSFHIYQTTDTTSSSYQANVYASSLWTFDPKTLQPIPNMAESWTVSDDAKTYTFKLRPDLEWSDGTPLTAHDFAWTYEQVIKPENQYPYIENLKEIVSYRAVDDRTLEIVLSEGTCVGLSTADAITPLPKHIWSTLDWSDPTQNPEIQNPSVGSGPYLLQEWRRDDHATFARNDDYFRGAPNFHTDTVRIVPNPSIQFQMLKSGEIDYAPVTAADYAEAKNVPILQEYNWDPAVSSWHFVGFNLRRPHLQDVEVRHALSFATPRDAISQRVFNGLAKPTYSNYPPTSWVYNPNVPRYDYSIDAAKETLQKAGYTLDASGKLLDKNGQPFPRLKILFNTGNRQREQIATIAQEEFRKLGIDSEVTGMEFQAYLEYLEKEPYDYDLYVLGWRSTFEPYFSYQIWSEQNIPSLNSGAYVNKEVERLYEQSNRPPCDSGSRKQVFGQIQEIISTDSPYIFLVYSTGYAFLNKRVVPNEPSPLGISYYPERWFMRAP